MNQPPRVSIITVSFNAEEYIERTIRSVIRQTYPNIEYIIIDGNSKDKTMDIINTYRESIDKIVSEPDRSLYDAMNKGLMHASGDYVLFMNAGDIILGEEALENMMAGSDEADLIYANAEFITEEGERRPLHKKTPPADKLSKKSFLNGMVICHQCMVVKRSIAPDFDLENLNIVSDIDWAIRVMDKVYTKHYWNHTFCLFLDGGLSAQKRVDAVKERFKVSKKHFGLLPTLIQQFKLAWEIIKRGRLA